MSYDPNDPEMLRAAKQLEGAELVERERKLQEGIPKGRLNLRGEFITPCRKGPLATYSRAASGNIVRDIDGKKLPHHYPPAFLRGFRSKYHRHIGAKQKAKAFNKLAAA